MKIKRFKGRDQSGLARGLTIVIDILRAATVEAFMLDSGVKYIIPVFSKEDAFKLKKENSSFLLVGEEDGIRIKGFDLGNSPSEIKKLSLKGKIVVHRSSAGTRSLVSAVNSDELIFGSLVTADAIVNYIKRRQPKIISILSLGIDDEACGDYLENAIRGNRLSREEIIKKVYGAPEVQCYFKDEKDFPREDLDLALDFDRFKFICYVEKSGTSLMTKKLFP